ncbi:MAG: hypothetical protein JSW05_11865 [Candidatus Thorarchaeota archaeon]|nr:MAG: hypothetical protein JSW05_11865 [Candidatus Thorarchaeota archaeon]
MRERMTAVRASVSDIVNGTYKKDNGHYVVSPHGVELRRVVLVGFIVEQFSRKDLASITIDDGTETIKAWAFDDEAKSLEKAASDALTLVVGKVREREGEVYIIPEIIRQIEDPNYLSLHLLERYSGMITGSGVTPQVVSDFQETLSESTRAETPESTEKIGSEESQVLGKVNRQILQFIENHSDKGGVPIDDIIKFFEERGHARSDIQLKVINLHGKGKIVEVSVGVYRLADT